MGAAPATNLKADGLLLSPETVGVSHRRSPR
jgi:hypothetical protein